MTLRAILRACLRFKFLITSHPKTFIDHGFLPENVSCIYCKLSKDSNFINKTQEHHSLHLIDIEAETVEKSGRLFIFTFTVIKYLSEPDLSSADMEG